MNSVLEKYAHNFIIDEIVYWPPSQKTITSIEAIVPNIGKCLARLHYHDGTSFDINIERGCFEKTWNEACAILHSVTNITEGLRRLTPREVAILEKERQDYVSYEIEQLEKEAQRIKKEQIEKAIELFDAGLYDVFLEQFGNNCVDIPAPIQKRIEIARGKIMPNN